ncbi:acid protease, partial [Exidia glandulosa HHB12029]
MVARPFVLVALFFTLVAAAPPLRTLPLTKRIDHSKVKNIVKSDQARAKGLKNVNKGDGEREPVNAFANGIAYVVNVAVGSPAATYSLIVDTGSSNTWIGADKSYQASNTSFPLDEFVSVSYGSGFFEGTAYADQVALSTDLVADYQIIAVADFSFGFEGYDGILGLGPTILTNGTVSDFELVDTVVDTLYYDGRIKARVLGAAFAPLNANGGVGSLAFGAPDPSHYTGLLSYTNVTKAYPSSLYFGIDVRFDYGPLTIGYGSGIVDIGTTLILLASDIFEFYANSTGGVYDYYVGLLRLDEEQYNKLQPLNLRINGATYELTANAQILPR